MIISRRSILGTAAAGVVTAATANAQTSDIPQPERPGKGGTDHWPARRYSGPEKSRCPCSTGDGQWDAAESEFLLADAQ
jgi:hypothetical protein